MPLGILSDDEFNKEVELYQDNLPSNPKVEYKELDKSGRKPGDDNKPETLRKVIADCKINGARDSEIMEVFKTSKSSIHAYENGKNGTSSPVDEKLAKFVKSVRGKVTRQASRKLIAALDSITHDKLAELKANELSITAKNLSSVIGDMEEKNKVINNNQGAQFIIFQPPQKSINSYDVIDVKS